MIFSAVRSQLETVFIRAIETGVAVQQNFPRSGSSNGQKSLGNLDGSAIALKNASYRDIYAELEKNKQFHIKLPDGGLLVYQYTFDNEDKIIKNRLGFFPSPNLPTFEENPELYEQDELYGDIMTHRIVRFPIRFDFDPKNYQPKFHPHSHLTLGQFDNCRIPVSHPLSPNDFTLFILRNFYHRLYKRHLNKFEKRMNVCSSAEYITDFERKITYICTS